MKSAVLRFVALVFALVAVPMDAGALMGQEPEDLTRLANAGPTQGGSSVGFGVALNEDGTLLAVGAPFAPIAPMGRGRVWLYRSSPMGYEPVAVLQPPATDETSGFGKTLRWMGDQLLVADDRADYNGELFYGAVYVYQRQGQVFSFVQRLRPTGLAGSALFGTQIFARDSEPDDVWVSAPGHDGIATNSGCLVRYSRVAGVWTESLRWYNADPQFTFAGGVAAFAGDKLVLKGGSHTLRVYEVDASGQLTMRQEIDREPAWNFVLFGSWIVATPETLFVANPDYATAPFVRRGRVHVYDKDASGDFVLSQTLTSWGPTLGSAAGDHFGGHFALDGNRLVVGAHSGFDAAGGNYPGIAYVFERTPQGWEGVETIFPSASPDIARFGHRVAIRGSTMAFGARDASTNFVQEGAVFVKERRLGEETCASTCGPAGSTTPGRLRAFGLPEPDQRRFGLLADDLPLGADGVLFLAGTDSPAPALRPGSGGCLCIGTTIQRLAYVPTSSGSVGFNPFSNPVFGSVGPMAASTTYFQAWYRDLSSGPGVNSRFSNSFGISWVP